MKIIDWKPNEPWPEVIEKDGVVLKYAHVWETKAGKQIIYYSESGEKKSMVGIDRKKLIAAKE